MRVRDSRGVSMSDFKSLLAPYIEGLIEQKQALGYIYKAQIEKLVKFDTMISENFPNETTITKEMTDIWAAKRSLYLEYAPIVHVDFKSNAPFFPGYHGKPITNNNLNANFRKFLFQAGISYGGRGKGPRIYDFRHTFAVNCLKNLVQRGADMNTYYPILKTYMGHSFFKYTEYYLRLTKNMYPDIGEKLNATLGSVIPEVWGDECE